MKDLDDFFVRKSSEYWKKSLIFDEELVDFYDKGRWLFIKNKNEQKNLNGYWLFDININKLDIFVQTVLNLIESDTLKLIKLDMLGFYGDISCRIYIDLDDNDANLKFFKCFIDNDFIKRNRFGHLEDIEFKNILTGQIKHMSNYIDLKTGMFI